MSAAPTNTTSHSARTALTLSRTLSVQAGVAGDRVRVVSYGKEKPFCSESTEACWQQNRRGGLSLDQ